MKSELTRRYRMRHQLRDWILASASRRTAPAMRSPRSSQASYSTDHESGRLIRGEDSASSSIARPVAPPCSATQAPLPFRP